MVMHDNMWIKKKSVRFQKSHQTRQRVVRVLFGSYIRFPVFIISYLSAICLLYIGSDPNIIITEKMLGGTISNYL
jgi:hypothetical protein